MDSSISEKCLLIWCFRPTSISSSLLLILLQIGLNLVFTSGLMDHCVYHQWSIPLKSIFLPLKLSCSLVPIKSEVKVFDYCFSAITVAEQFLIIFFFFQKKFKFLSDGRKSREKNWVPNFKCFYRKRLQSIKLATWRQRNLSICQQLNWNRYPRQQTTISAFSGERVASSIRPFNVFRRAFIGVLL